MDHLDDRSHLSCHVTDFLPTQTTSFILLLILLAMESLLMLEQRDMLCLTLLSLRGKNSVQPS